MRRTLILLPLIIFCCSCFPQVQFQSISFEQALTKARETGQLIFLQYESETCDQCNEVADKAFEDKKLANRLKEGFICIKINHKSPDRNNVADLYDKENAFGTLFITPDGALVHTFLRSTTMADSYFKEIDQALTKAGEGLRLTELEKQRNRDLKNIFLTQELLILRKSLYLNTDTLLDEYVSLLSPDSLKSLSELAFIAQQCPIIGSKADIILRKTILFLLKRGIHLPFLFASR